MSRNFCITEREVNGQQLTREKLALFFQSQRYRYSDIFNVGLDESQLPVKVTTKIGIFFSTLAILLGFPFVSATWHEMKYRENEVQSLAAMRDIRLAQKTFKAERGRYGTLQELASSKLIRAEIGTGKWFGYLYSVEAETEHYRARAVPKVFGPKLRDSTGGRGLYLDETGVIRGSSTNVNNPSLEDEPLNEQ